MEAAERAPPQMRNSSTDPIKQFAVTESKVCMNVRNSRRDSNMDYSDRHKYNRGIQANKECKTLPTSLLPRLPQGVHAPQSRDPPMRKYVGFSIVAMGTWPDPAKAPFTYSFGFSPTDSVTATCMEVCELNGTVEVAI